MRHLTLARMGSRRERGLWFAAGIVDVERHRNLECFVTVVARFGLAKQRAELGVELGADVLSAFNH